MADDDTQSDYCEEEEEEDDEATLDEEDEQNDSDEDYGLELRELQEEGELSLEELQRKYYRGEGNEEENRGSDEVVVLPPLPSSSPPPREDAPSSSATTAGAVPTTACRAGVSLRHKIFCAIAGTCGQLTQKFDAYFKSEDLEDDDTEDYVPPELWKKSIRVGEDYQVSVLPPPLQPTRQHSIDEHLAEKLWAPSAERCPDQLLIAYLLDCERIRAGEKSCRKRASVPSTTAAAALVDPSGIIPDNEDALTALYQANYDAKAAKATVQCDGPSTFSEFANTPKLTHPGGGDPWRAWSDEECEQFEQGMAKCFKCFWKIRRDFLPNRTVGELVTFYYCWKKSERHDLWKAEKCRREQQVDAKTTDFMGQLAESFLRGENKAEDGEKEAPQPTKTHLQQQQNGVGALNKEKQ
uniref:Mesoderm induction early response protein 1 n=1 Tax=Globodera rostochiensis TaxID=31243 RepID=A0A914H609_GLORO